MMNHHVDIVKSHGELQKRVRALGTAITKDYAGKDLVLVGVLNGAFVFLGDLVRSIHTPLAIDFIRLESYIDTHSTGRLRITANLAQSIEEKDVLVVEDIVDSGRTLEFLLPYLRAQNPASLKVCALLSKPSRRTVDVVIDYCGFEIPDVFVIGYGMDFNEKFRNLPNLYAL